MNSVQIPLLHLLTRIPINEAVINGTPNYSLSILELDLVIHNTKTLMHHRVLNLKEIYVRGMTVKPLLCLVFQSPHLSRIRPVMDGAISVLQNSVQAQLNG